MDELIYYFVDDNELLELINSVSSYTMNDESIKKGLYYQFNKSNENNNYQHITFWDTSKITTMENMFSFKKQFNELLLWNTKNVTNMAWMFHFNSSFNQPLEFNTRNTRHMSWMFCDAISFNQTLEFNTDNVIDMYGMFKNSGMKNYTV